MALIVSIGCWPCDLSLLRMTLISGSSFPVCLVDDVFVSVFFLDAFLRRWKHEIMAFNGGLIQKRGRQGWKKKWVQQSVISCKIIHPGCVTQAHHGRCVTSDARCPLTCSRDVTWCILRGTRLSEGQVTWGGGSVALFCLIPTKKKKNCPRDVALSCPLWMLIFLFRNKMLRFEK